MPEYGYRGYAKIGATAIFTNGAADFDRPRNLAIPYPIGNHLGQTNFSEGMRFPVVNIPAIVMASWFTAANLNTWVFTRGSQPTYDTAAVAGGVEFMDAANGHHQILNPKCARFTFGVRFGQNPLLANFTFHGTHLDTPGAAPAAITEAPLTFASVTLGGSFAGKGIIGIQLDYANQLTPNESLAGTQYPSEHNADIPVATVTIQQYAAAASLPPGYTDANTYVPITDATLSVQVGSGPTVMTTFAFSNLVIANPNARRQTPGRIIRSFQYHAMATASLRPVVCSAT